VRAGAEAERAGAEAERPSPAVIGARDDDEAIRFGMTALLSELGCHVLTAASSQEAA
jgi:CheY-like chemotaxis protein